MNYAKVIKEIKFPIAEENEMLLNSKHHQFIMFKKFDHLCKRLLINAYCLVYDRIPNIRPNIRRKTAEYSVPNIRPRLPIGRYSKNGEKCDFWSF